MTNYGAKALFGISLPFEAAVSDIKIDANGTSSGGRMPLKKRSTITGYIPKPLGPQETFEFFVAGSYKPDEFIDISPPSSAIVDSDDKSAKGVHIPIRVTFLFGKSMGLLPIRTRANPIW